MLSSDPRPQLTKPFERLLDDLTQRLEELQAIEAKRILVVGLSARGSGAATVRSFQGNAKSVIINDDARTWELGLRPVFFQTGDAARRLTTLIHELLHLSATDPSGFRPEFRHATCSQHQLDEIASTLAERWLKISDVDLIQPLAHHGEGLLRHWLIRPSETHDHYAFTDADVFDAPISMKTPPSKRSVWWNTI